MNITRGRKKSAKKIVIYGPSGIGKSTLAAQFPDPLFIDTEDSTVELDVARFVSHRLGKCFCSRCSMYRQIQIAARHWLSIPQTGQRSLKSSIYVLR